MLLFFKRGSKHAKKFILFAIASCLLFAPIAVRLQEQRQLLIEPEKFTRAGTVNLGELNHKLHSSLTDWKLANE